MWHQKVNKVPAKELPLWASLVSAYTGRPDVCHQWEKVSGTREGLAAPFEALGTWQLNILKYSSSFSWAAF